MSSPADSPAPEPGVPSSPPDGSQAAAAPAEPPAAAPVQPEPVEIDAGPFHLAETSDDQERRQAGSRRTIRTVLLGALLVIIVAGAVTLGYVGWQVNTQRHAALSTPPTIGDLTLDDSEDATATAEYLRSAISAEITMDKAVGAVYTSPDDKTVLFFGGTRLLWSPDTELENAFTLLGDEEAPVTDLQDVDPGSLGGTMRCGTTTSDGTPLSICGWADHGSLAVAMFPDRAQSEAAALMSRIRAGTQTRG